MLAIDATHAGRALGLGVVLTAFGFGFRHGIDWDHIAALTDITSSQDRPKRSLFLATMYALGHALVVLALGFGAIVLGASLPNGVDAVMERVVGATLVVLACYVFFSVATKGRDFRMRSRWMLVIGAVQRFFRRRNRGELVEIVHEHAHVHVQAHTHAHADGHGHGTVHAHVGRMPDDPFVNYARGTALGVGMLHGIGAETPTQVVIFLTAAGVGGKTTGMLVLASFVVGLLASNTVVAAAATFGLLGASRNFGVYAAVSLVTAVFSLVVGAIFLFGSAAMLPSMLGG